MQVLNMQECIYCYRHNIFYKRLSDALLMSVAKCESGLLCVFFSLPCCTEPYDRFMYELVVWSWLLGEQKQKESSLLFPFSLFKRSLNVMAYSSLIPSVIISLLFAVPFVSSHRRHDREGVRDSIHARLHAYVSKYFMGFIYFPTSHSINQT